MRKQGAFLMQEMRWNPYDQSRMDCLGAIPGLLCGALAYLWLKEIFLE